MTERYTRRDAERAFERLAKALGKSTGEAWTRQEDGTYKANIGTWFLDNAPIYGGVVIVEIASEGGGESRPFGNHRIKHREFCDAVNFALNVLHIEREGK